jgi:hypothetical protein
MGLLYAMIAYMAFKTGDEKVSLFLGASAERTFIHQGKN